METHILLVEDSADEELLTLRSLKKAGVEDEIKVARDGAQALQALAEGALPKMVLLDLHMPKLDGHEVLKRLREDERTRQLPVVMLTSSKKDADVSRSYALGANAYVVKPVDMSEFSEAVGRLGRFWLQCNVFPRS